MRLKDLLPLSLSAVLSAGLALAAAPASAQDDEFGDLEDEFDDPEEGGGGTSDGGGSGDDEFDDLEDDSLGDDGEGTGGGATGGLQDGDLDDETPPSGDDQDDEPRSDDDERAARRERRMHLHNTWQGSVGGIHVVDAGSGADAAFRAQLGLDFFFVDGWLTLNGVSPDRSTNHSHIGGSLSLSWTPFEFLEIYASIASYANSNEQEDPNLFQVLGDTLFGVKAFYNFEDLRWLTLGGDVSLMFLNTVGDIGLVGDSTGFGIRANATIDLRELPDRIPFIARLNLGYILDNSSALVSDVERRRYAALADPRPCPPDPATGDCQEDRHLITRVERYSLQIDRVDRFRIGIGLEAPIVAMENVGDAGADFVISPIAEYTIDIPVNRQGYSCLFIPGAGTPDMPAVGEDGCLDKQGGSAFESRLTLGVRVLPPLQGMSIFVAVDIGTTGVNTFVRELSGQEPYDVRLGFGYAFDTVPRIEEVEREVIREVDRTPPAAPRGRVIGTVVEQGAGTPVAGAIVEFPGRELTAQSSNPAGGFTSYEFDPGEVAMAISHPEYHQGTCAATIAPEGGDVEVRCELEALPRLGNIRAHVVSDSGGPVGSATVNLTGPANRSSVTGPDGSLNVNDLQPGTYTARVDAEGYLLSQTTIEVRARETAEPTITLIARPSRSQVVLQQRQIMIRRQVNFATDSADILPDSTPLLTEIADVILRHPELLRIEIQGHTDDRGGRQHNQDLSQRRADSVRDWLVRAGVDAGRLEARGYGQDTPLVPNITAANRARNRRVQFVISERSE
ncbi:MAG: OmpA family protein [Sandaracinaceae bacterium]